MLHAGRDCNHDLTIKLNGHVGLTRGVPSPGQYCPSITQTDDMPRSSLSINQVFCSLRGITLTLRI